MLKPHHLALHHTDNVMLRLLLITFISLSASSLADIYNKKDEKTYEGFEIQALGNMPYMIDNHQLQIKIKNNNIRSITATDINGYAVSEVSFPRTNDGIEFTPPEDTIYLILRR